MEEPFKALVKRERKTNKKKNNTASLEVLQWNAGKKLWRKSKNAPNCTLAPEISLVKNHGKQVNLGEISPYRFLNQLLKSDHAKYIRSKNNMKWRETVRRWL